MPTDESDVEDDDSAGDEAEACLRNPDMLLRMRSEDSEQASPQSQQNTDGQGNPDVPVMTTAVRHTALSAPPGHRLPAPLPYQLSVPNVPSTPPARAGRFSPIVIHPPVVFSRSTSPDAAVGPISLARVDHFSPGFVHPPVFFSRSASPEAP